jgi:peroxiredoxin
LQKLEKYREKYGIGFQLLSDADLSVIRSWGLVNSNSPQVPHPTAIVLDRDGVVRYLRQDVDYKRRPPVEELLAAIDSIDDRRPPAPQ